MAATQQDDRKEGMTMSTRHAMKTFSLGIFLCALFLAGCAVPPVKIMPYPGVSSYPPTDPASIVVMETSPLRAHQTLGNVVLVPEHELSPSEVDQLLREAAGSMGAHAVIMLANMNMVAGANSAQMWGGHVISAVAIRYTD